MTSYLFFLMSDTSENATNLKKNKLYYLLFNMQVGAESTNTRPKSISYEASLQTQNRKKSLVISEIKKKLQ